MLIATLALLVRGQALQRLPVDYDEAIYLHGAQTQATGLQRGDLSVIFSDESPENPSLMKVLYGLAVATQPAQAEISTDLHAAIPTDLLHAARWVAVAGSVLSVFILSLVSPVAGIALALHTLHIKYGSEVLLEALPIATGLVCVLFYQRSERKLNRWLVLSAIALGLTATSKYVYAIVSVAVLLDWAWSRFKLPRDVPWPRTVAHMLIWGALAVVIFCAANPYFWPDPIGRVISSLLFHRQNASTEINTGRYDLWQPLVWLATTPSLRPDLFLVRLDPVILALAAFGLVPLWRTQRVQVLWLASGLGFLLIYSNKWPQYPLIIVVPLCLAAAAGLQDLVRFLRTHSLESVRQRWVQGLLMGVAMVWGVWLGQNWHQADPAFRAALSEIQTHIQPDEVAVFASANPAVEVVTLDPARANINLTSSRALTASTTSLDFNLANAWLAETAAGKRGVWLLTYDAALGDPADGLKTLLTRQAHLLSPAFTQTYSRTYELTYFRFDLPYEPMPSAAQFDSRQIEANYGNAVGLSSNGCAQFRPARAGEKLEVACLWQTQPFVPLPWDTRVSLRLFNANGQQVTQSDPLLLRSGFPLIHLEQPMLGTYFVDVPADLAPGPYTLRAFAYSQAGEYSPRVSTQVVIDAAAP